MQINLLYKKHNYKRLEELFSLFRKLVTVLSIVGLVIAAGIYLYFVSQENQYKQLLKTKEILLSRLVLKKNLEAKLVYVVDKTRLFDETKKNSSAHDIYLNAFLQMLPEDQKDTLKSFSIDKEKHMQALLDFPSTEGVYTFLSAIQKEQFLGFYSELKVNAITFSPLPLNTIGVQVSGTIQKPQL